MTENQLTEIARQVRSDKLTMSFREKRAHTGGALSVVEILVSLYFSVMHVNPKNSNDPIRDQLIFSKAHDAKALYSILARRGFFPPAWLDGYEIDGGRQPSHSTCHCAPGVEASTGSLGHGLPKDTVIALALKLNAANSSPLMVHSNTKHKIVSPTHNLQPKTSRSRVFAVLSDGECGEGSIWEAALVAAGHHNLDNLMVIVDYNKLQGYGHTKDILDLEPFGNKWKAFG